MLERLSEDVLYLILHYASEQKGCCALRATCHSLRCAYDAVNTTLMLGACGEWSVPLQCSLE